MTHSCALVLGGRSHRSLAVVRHLGRRGIFLRTVDTAPSNFGISRYTNDPVLLRESKEAPLLQALIALSKEEEKNPVLLPTSPLHTAFMAKYFSQLKEYFRFPADKVEDLLCNGNLFSDLAPETADIIDDDAFPISVATAVGFPCLIKPRSVKGSPEPARFISGPAALSRAVEDLSNKDAYVVERYIPGDVSNNCMATLYYAEGARLTGFVTAEVLRQWPEAVGSATYVKQKWIPELIGLVHPRLKAVDFRGLINVRFKRDEFSRKIYVTGCDTAFSSETELHTHLGFDTPYLYYLDALGEPLPKTFFQSDTNCHFKDGYGDMKAVYSYLKSGHMGLMKILSDYKFRKVPATWAWDDMGPGLNKLGSVGLRGLKHLVKKWPLKKPFDDFS